MNTRQLHDHALEESWMGALLHSPELIPQVLTTSENIDFIDRVDLSAGWSAMADMYQKGIAIDPVSLGTYLKTNGLLTERDVDEMISNVALLGGNTDHFESWTDQLATLGRLRDAYSLGGDLQRMIQQGAGLDAVVEEVSKRIVASSGSKRPSYAGEVAAEMLREFQDQRIKGTISNGLLTGLYEVDQCTGGLEVDDYFGICARPSNGKTALALQMVRNMLASYSEGRILFFSLEMSAERLIRRQVASLSGVPFIRIRTGEVTEEEAARIEAAFEIVRLWLDRLVIYTPRNFPGGLTGPKIVNTIRAHALREKILISFVDNFNLIPYRDRTELNDHSRSFKATALDTQSPNGLLIQLNRSNEKTNRPPILSDIKETGQIEQDLDRCLLVDREDMRNSTVKDQWENLGIIEGLAFLDLAKNRDGARQAFMRMFHADTMSFLPYVMGMSTNASVGPKPPPLPAMFN